ncbi:MAG: hypothetical protein V8K32_03895 [Candidatus Electrothrix gigas]
MTVTTELDYLKIEPAQEAAMASTQRTVLPIHNDFFNDGHWHVLSSTSLGGSGLSAAEMDSRLWSQNPKGMNDLLQRGICLPLYIDCDCALDNVVFVLGDLTEQEEAEWLGRIQIRLEIPCGEFMLVGGGLEEDFDVALQHFEPPNCEPFYKIKLKPGSYLVEVYAFLSSCPVNNAFREWLNTDPRDQPQWLSFFQEDGYVENEDIELLEHIIRLVPTDADTPIPQVRDDMNCWVGDFIMRKPLQCPQGLQREEVIRQL